MSTNKTSNYQLHSWLPQDEFHLTEINENFTKLDTAIKAEAGTAAQQAEALLTRIIKKPDFLFGSYVGQGSSTPIRLDLGVKPLAIIVTAITSSQTTIDYQGMGAPGYSYKGSFAFDDTGITITYANTNAFSLVGPNETYYYIVFY